MELATVIVPVLIGLLMYWQGRPASKLAQRQLEQCDDLNRRICALEVELARLAAETPWHRGRRGGR